MPLSNIYNILNQSTSTKTINCLPFHSLIFLGIHPDRPINQHQKRFSSQFKIYNRSVKIAQLPLLAQFASSSSGALFILGGTRSWIFFKINATRANEAL